MIQVRKLAFSYEKKKVLDIESFSISPGTRTLIRGPSGSGKTTFLMLLRGILLPSAEEHRNHG